LVVSARGVDQISDKYYRRLEPKTLISRKVSALRVLYRFCSQVFPEVLLLDSRWRFLFFYQLATYAGVEFVVTAFSCNKTFVTFLLLPSLRRAIAFVAELI